MGHGNTMPFCNSQGKMMYMMMFVLDNPDHLDSILDAWKELGVGGATIFESTGYYRRRHAQPLGARYLFGAPSAAAQSSQGNLTLFSIVPDETLIQRCIETAESIVGDLDQPHTGVFASWELAMGKGFNGVPESDEA